jgi:uncharacterized Zn-finger protein
MNTDKIQSNAERVYHVRLADLPVSCPRENMPLWCSHPRVFLPLATQREVVCPYCSARYIVDDFESSPKPAA